MKMFCPRHHKFCLQQLYSSQSHIYRARYLGSTSGQNGLPRSTAALSRKTNLLETVRFKLKLSVISVLARQSHPRCLHPKNFLSFKDISQQRCKYCDYFLCTSATSKFASSLSSYPALSCYSTSTKMTKSSLGCGIGLFRDSTCSVIKSDQKQISTRSNCEFDGAEGLLQSIDVQLNQNSLLSSSLAHLAGQFQTLVQAELPVPYLSIRKNLRGKWLEKISPEMDILSKYRSDDRWKQFMSFTKSQLTDLSVTDQITILNCLNSLLISSEDELFDSLFHTCISNICSLSLRELLVLSDVASESEYDFVSQGQLAAAIHDRVLNSDVERLSLSDLCDTLLNLQKVLGIQTLELVAHTVKRKLHVNPSSVTAGDVIRAYQLMVACGEPLLEDLALDAFNDLTIVIQDLPVLGFDLASVVEHPWPISDLLTRVSAHCLAHLNDHLEQQKRLDQEGFACLSYCLQALSHEQILPLIADASVLQLVQMIGHHVTSSQLKMPAAVIILEAYNNRLTKLISSLSQDQFDSLLSHNSGQFTPILMNFFNCLSAQDIQPDAGLVAKLCRSSAFDLRQVGWDIPPSIAKVLLHEALDKFSSDVLVSPRDLLTLTSLTHRLDLKNSLIIHEELDGLIVMPQRSSQVKRQVQRLRATIQARVYDRLRWSRDLPESLATGFRHANERELKVHRRRSRPGLYEVLLENLGRYVASGGRRKSNHLGALAILDCIIEIWPTYQEKLFEDLADFVMNECPHSLSLGLRLLKILSTAGYQPLDADTFSDWVSELVAKVIDLGDVDLSLQVELANSLSLLGIFHDDFVRNIFNLGFITNLHKELLEKPRRSRGKVMRNLIFLSRSIAIECPHLAIAYLGNNDGSLYRPPRQEELDVQKVVASLRRICCDNTCVVSPALSPYGHRIDALMVLDSNLQPMPVSESNLSEDHRERLAFLYLNENHFCLGQTDHQTGQSLTAVRQLQMLGYNVIMLTHTELSSMVMYSDEATDDLVRDKINQAVGVEVFLEREEK